MQQRFAVARADSLAVVTRAGLGAGEDVRAEQEVLTLVAWEDLTPTQAARALDAHLAQHHAATAALIVEPLVQGASCEAKQRTSSTLRVQIALTSTTSVGSNGT